MKPTDCWYCEYVGKCSKIYLHTCNNYKKFEYDTVHKICDIIGISKRQFYRYKDKYGLKLSDYIYNKYNVWIDIEVEENGRFLYKVVDR